MLMDFYVVDGCYFYSEFILKLAIMDFNQPILSVVDSL